MFSVAKQIYHKESGYVPTVEHFLNFLLRFVAAQIGSSAAGIIAAQRSPREAQVERTLVLIKPDGVERRLVGEILARFERRGMRIVGLKLVHPDRALAERHYAVHAGKPFYESLVSFITSGPVVAAALEANNAVALVRRMMGALKPEEALPGTIRGDYTTEVQTNLVHGSDAVETAQAELNLWFTPDELLP
jgi:nucleoside-diphosphate kinase